MAYWLMKSEPGSWSWQQQMKSSAKGEAWSGVRNHQAKQNLMKMKKGDRAFFYHSGEDKAAVGRANGVGPKLALRIVTELKGKPITDGPVMTAAPSAAATPSVPAKPAATGDAVAALMGLGVAEVNARRVVEAAAAQLGEEATVQALIKAGLQELGR